MTTPRFCKRHCWSSILRGLKIKEAFHINWKKPNLNTHQNHLALTLSLLLLPPSPLLIIFCLCLFFLFLFNVLLSLSLTLIIGIFYCLNYVLLLLFLIANTLYHLFLFHLLFSLSLCWLSASFTVLITLCYYLISLRYVLGNYYDSYRCN